MRIAFRLTVAAALSAAIPLSAFHTALAELTGAAHAAQAARPPAVKPISVVIPVATRANAGPPLNAKASPVKPDRRNPDSSPPALPKSVLLPEKASAAAPRTAGGDSRRRTRALGKLRLAFKSIVRPENGGEGLGWSSLRVLFDGAQERLGLPLLRYLFPPGPPPIKESPPGFKPHERVPMAILPDGRALPPDSFMGGFHGTDMSPEAVLRAGGLPARGALEDWRLLEHTEHSDAPGKPASAFRGSTPFPTSPDGETGASYWAGEGGWVYEVKGVPTWDVNATLEGRVQGPDGKYRGNRWSELESAFPARTPAECIERWGQAKEGLSGKIQVMPGDWVANPRYDPVRCRAFWGAAAPL